MSNTLDGGGGDDELIGGDGNELILGGAGNDLLIGQGGDDTLEGGDDSDSLFGGTGTNVLRGDAGADLYVIQDNSVSEISEFRGDSDQTIIDTIELRDVDSALELEAKNANGSLEFNNLSGTISGFVFGQYNETDTFRHIEVLQFGNGDSFNITVGDTGGQFADILIGSDGADLFSGNGGDDVLIGGFQADTLQGGDGADTLIGDTGANLLRGDSGADTYVVRTDGRADFSEFRGDADQTIQDRILFTNIEDASDFLAKRVGTGNASLEFSNNSRSVSGSVFKQFEVGEEFRSIEVIEFNDGTLFEIAPTFDGGSGNEMVVGTDGDDLLTGGDGIDVLYGGFASDTLEGGDGDDSLFGGTGVDLVRGDGGADTYYVARFQRSDISEFRGDNDQTILDRIVLQGIETAEDAQFLRTGSSADTLFFRALDGSTTGSVFRHFNESQAYRRVEEVEFNDGSVYTLETGLGGDSGDNIIVGTTGADSIDAGAGDDILFGGFGADTFVFTTGDDADTIDDFSAGSGFDKLRLSVGTDFDTFAEVDAAASQVGDDVLIDFGNGDSVTLRDTLVDDLVAADFEFF